MQAITPAIRDAYRHYEGIIQLMLVGLIYFDKSFQLAGKNLTSFLKTFTPNKNQTKTMKTSIQNK